MAYCTNCGNQVDDAARFCNVCGTVVTGALATAPQPAPTSGVQSPPQPAAPPPPPQAAPLPPQAAPAGLDIANNWGIPLLAAGLLMGLIALFIGWTEGLQDSRNAIDYIKDSEIFKYVGAPWWLALFALLSFIGVALLAISFLAKIVPASPIPDVPGIGALGAVMLALFPLFTHVGFWLSAGSFDRDAGDVWFIFWATDRPGIWLALAGGIIAFVGNVAVENRARRSF